MRRTRRSFLMETAFAEKTTFDIIAEMVATINGWPPPELFETIIARGHESVGPLIDVVRQDVHGWPAEAPVHFAKHLLGSIRKRFPGFWNFSLAITMKHWKARRTHWGSSAPRHRAVAGNRRRRQSALVSPCHRRHCRRQGRRRRSGSSGSCRQTLSGTLGQICR